MLKQIARLFGTLLVVWACSVLLLNSLTAPAGLVSTVTPSVLNNETDLKAQLRMADAAEATADYTRWSLWLGALNVVGLIVVLSLNILANRTSANALSEASEANDLARDVAHIELRAWLTPDGTGTEVLWNQDRLRGVNFLVHWINTGPTPATSTTPSTRCYILDNEDPVPTGPIERATEFSEGVIGHNCKISGIVFIDGDSLHALARREKKCVVYARVQYRDVFSNVLRETKIHVRLIATASEANLEAALKAGTGLRVMDMAGSVAT